MAITKTKNIGLTKDDKTEHYSVDRVNANSDLIDLEFSKVKDNIGNIKETSLEGYDEVEHGKKSAANFVKFIWSKLGSIELTDLKIKVTTWENHTLDKVLNKIKGWIGTLTNLKTKEKTNIVGAINELYDNNENLKQAELLDRQDIVKIKSELTGEDEELKLNNEKFAQLLGVRIEDIRGGAS